MHEHAGTGLAAVAISSNSVTTHPQDGPDRMVEDAKQFGARSSHRRKDAPEAFDVNQNQRGRCVVYSQASSADALVTQKDADHRSPRGVW